MRKAAYVNLNQPEDNAHTLIQNLQFILQICVKLSAVPKADLLLKNAICISPLQVRRVSGEKHHIRIKTETVKRKLFKSKSLKEINALPPKQRRYVTRCVVGFNIFYMFLVLVGLENCDASYLHLCWLI
jgi:hypothetical protein